jgi:alkylhydroperoxidase family enzyme
MLPSMSWLPESGPGRDDFARTFALRPDLFAAWQDFASVFWEKRLVDPVLLELCRLRIAQLHGAAYPLSTRMREASEAGLDEARIARLADWWTQPGFTGLERACLRFAEQFVLDAKAMSDEEARPVVAALGDAGTVAFVEALAIFDGFSRFCRMLDVQPVEVGGTA